MGERQEPERLAPPYRRALVLDSLRACCQSSPAAGPHPRTPDYLRPASAGT